MTADYAKRQRARGVTDSGNWEEHQETELERVDEGRILRSQIATSSRETRP